ncbi:MAG: UDP-N-acetylmuramoyl-tripeptide--D-alanyl-D-alanine ligase [Robiginitomaculum sp.]
MSVLWTGLDAARATGGNAIGAWSVSGLSIDTRTIKPGELFVPLKDMRDGHDFIPMALEKGAVVMSERAIDSVPALKVNDALIALRGLAVAARARCDALRIAVTGSVGKTSVKEAIYVALSPSAKTHKSVKSFNNHWGVPLTLALMPRETQYGVLETGMNHAGELSDLSKLLAPNIAIITKIAEVHLEHFENIKAIARAKAEIFDGMEAGGTAILNADDDFFKFLSGKAKARGLKVVSVGVAPSADICISGITASGRGLKAVISGDGFQVGLDLQNSGEHHALNAGFAIAAAYCAGANITKAAKALSALAPLKGRGEVFTSTIEGFKATIIDESYNANPTSMSAAIAAFGRSEKSAHKIAILGGMGELGKDELALNAAMAAPLLAHNIDRVITVGPLMRGLHNALPAAMRGPWVASATDVLSVLKTEIKQGSAVMLKGSNSIGLGAVITQLKQGNI